MEVKLIECNEFVSRSIERLLFKGCKISNLRRVKNAQYNNHHYICEVDFEGTFVYCSYSTPSYIQHSLNDLAAGFNKNIIRFFSDFYTINDFHRIVFDALNKKEHEVFYDILPEDYYPEISAILGDFINSISEKGFGRFEIYNYCLNNFKNHLLDSFNL